MCSVASALGGPAPEEWEVMSRGRGHERSARRRRVLMLAILWTYIISSVR